MLILHTFTFAVALFKSSPDFLNSFMRQAIYCNVGNV